VKNNIHPAYGYVVFRDRSADYQFLTRSTATSDKTIEWADGNTYPVVDVQISAGSHPFWTGRSRLLDTAGRVEKFRAKYARARGER
jgi:large subunit ribosomal protein L31